MLPYCSFARYGNIDDGSAVMYSLMMEPVSVSSLSSPGSHLATMLSTQRPQLCTPHLYVHLLASSSVMATAITTATRKGRSKTGDGRRRTKGPMGH